MLGAVGLPTGARGLARHRIETERARHIHRRMIGRLLVCIVVSGRLFGRRRRRGLIGCLRRGMVRHRYAGSGDPLAVHLTQCFPGAAAGGGSIKNCPAGAERSTGSGATTSFCSDFHRREPHRLCERQRKRLCLRDGRTVADLILCPVIVALAIVAGHTVPCVQCARHRILR